MPKKKKSLGEENAAALKKFAKENGITPPPIPPALPSEQFDPGPIAEELNIWRNGSRSEAEYFECRNEGKRWARINASDIARILRLRGYSNNKSDGASWSKTDSILRYIDENRIVDYAGDFAGYLPGIHYEELSDSRFIALMTQFMSKWWF